MKIVQKDGKFFLVGTASEVGRTLLKKAKDSAPIDLGWSLNKQADEAAAIAGDKYRCDGCGHEGIESDWVAGGCPECRSKIASKL